MTKEMNKKLDTLLRILMILVCLAMLAYHGYRCLSPNYWGDEAFTLRLAPMNVSQMIAETAADVHPPLYYLLVQAACRIFGYETWVYRGVSMLPYVIELILVMTLVWKKLGWEAAVPLVFFLSILKNAINFNNEVRMYSWGALFVVLSFYYLYRLLACNRTRDYAGFAFFSLCAAYTQYYCLISVAFFYVVMLICGLIWRDKYLKKALLASAATVVVYLPWFVVLLKTMARTSGNYWMTDIPSLGDCFKYLFSGMFQKVYFVLWMGLTFLLLLRLMKLLPQKLAKLHAPEGNLGDDDNNRILWIWIIAGLLSVFGTIAVGLIVSRLVRPVFMVRYLYPVSQIAWLLMGVALAKTRGKQLWALLLAAMIVFGSSRAAINEIRTMNRKDALLAQTLELTQGEIGPNDVILTTKSHISWTVAGCYYPGIECRFLDTAQPYPELKEGTMYWLFLSVAAGNEENVISSWEQMGYHWEEVIHKGNLGTYGICVYKLVP